MAVGHIVFDRADWFLSDAFARFAQELADRLTIGPNTMGYGLSMGGFGALYWADFLGLSSALLLAPQAEMTPGAIPNEMRWSRYNLPPHQIKPHRSQMIVVTDQTHALDMAHAALISDMGPTMLLDVPHLGHGVAKTLAEARCLKPLVKICKAGGSENQIRREILNEECLSGSSTWLSNKARTVPRPEKEDLLNRALALKPDNHTARYRLGISLLHHRPQDGHDMFKPLFARNLDRPYMRTQYLKACADLSLQPQAMDLA